MWLRRGYCLAVGCLVLLGSAGARGGDLELTLRYREATAPQSSRFHTLTRQETWPAERTAIIVCDMWDSHSCRRAVLRVEELVPRLRQVLETARTQGVTIIHAPSNCMESYADHPARQRAIAVPKSSSLPEEITKWCYQIPSEEQGIYPVDQTDGGCDDDPEEHAAWVQTLMDQGRPPRSPWTHQHPGLPIDGARDYISDRGDEVWSILEAHGIENVILTGVHTNMCVLGRPFGLRQMARNGKHVVLMRDMTDTMYNPQRAPFVSHFTGTDLIVGHIEKYVCPTITSNQLIGGEEFRFRQDTRPHVAFVTAEDEYETETTLPKYAVEHLGKEFRVSEIFGSESKRGDIPGLEALAEADVLLVSIRRRPLSPEQLKAFREWVAAGKPVVGIRTSSHAFSLRNQPAPEGLADWPEFDAEVFGGNYTNHHGNNLISTIRFNQRPGPHPLLSNVPQYDFPAGGSLYRTSPLKKGTDVFLTGSVEGAEPEPVAWTFTRGDGGKSFYTSLGHPRDFENPVFQRLLLNAVRWAAQPEADGGPVNR